MKYQFASTEDLLQFLREEIISAAEAAEILEVSKARIGQLVSDGKLNTVKEQPKMFLRSIVLEKKEELEMLRTKYRPYDK
ncbi:DNA-binding protein [Psychrobacillus sp. FSL K6-1267]|uniref:DNA-binding protein n=1 Tax=Psychrobacillus sp. FSL K6-1267 TaxID=2921543 RepID=UPI0030F51F89